MDDERVVVEPTQIMVRVTPDLKSKIKALVDAGKYTTMADFMRSAAIEKLIRDQSGEAAKISILDELDKPEVQTKLKSLWINFLKELR